MTPVTCIRYEYHPMTLSLKTRQNTMVCENKIRKIEQELCVGMHVEL
jgi:hypothetical protein